MYFYKKYWSLLLYCLCVYDDHMNGLDDHIILSIDDELYMVEKVFC